ncbi:hypothetical protein GCM10010124_26370 [Pilimelia terevasa]|uniref:Uncharacterized protein n=1 Tax=Pilimelia terevasa TaxID=53372 RepID=A0A8J3BSJ6_9ACTN|nr:hypothetical protein [Pilimelia terevasa]GGK32319.1 hypothetical protein GCM10010124_26370 [Pilimelia terevasa]
MNLPATYVTRYRATGDPATVRRQVAQWSGDREVARVVVDRLPGGLASATGKVLATRAAADVAAYWPPPPRRAAPSVSPRAAAAVAGGVTVLGAAGLALSTGNWPAVLVVLVVSGVGAWAA